MYRRDVLSVLGTALATPILAQLAPDELLAVGRRAHHRARGRALAVLDPHQTETVATIAEMIIPATDTPGARAARVHEFIDLLLAEWGTDEERASFLAGLADVDARARAAFGGDFLGATDAQRATILTALDGEVQARRATKADGQPPFFAHMKWLTVFGYCTSEVGAKAELHYEVIPGSFDACSPLDRWRATPGDY